MTWNQAAELKKCNAPFYAKRYPTKKAALSAQSRYKSNGKRVRLLNNFCAGYSGYKSGYVLASKTKINGWVYVD